MLAQTLHGYDQGHRLLARGGDVDDAELGLLDRLSDLSGYVPLGTEFDAYHTGFACGRYFAFACTWPDRSAVRAGTVLTHTLLIPLEALGRVHDLWALDELHRRPDSASDRAAYGAPLVVDLDAAGAAGRPPTPIAERALAAIVLWFGQADRPVLWMENTPDDVTRYLWGLLWGEARQRFAFCTFALQVRHVRRRLFGFLALPPSARGSFHDRARSAAWWQDDALASATLQKRTSQAWAVDVLERGPEATWAMPRYCLEHELPLLDEQQFPAFHRFMELEEAADARLTAARARADLVTRLWPELLAEHALMRQALLQLLRRQGEAAMSPRPFWDLDDFLGRRAVAALVAADESFAALVADVLAHEVERRLLEAGVEAADGLAAMLGRVIAPPFVEALLRGVHAAFERSGDDAAVDSKAVTLLVGSAEVRSSVVAEVVLGALSPKRRVNVALAARRQAPLEWLAPLDDHLLTAATRLADPTLAAELWLAQGRALEALRAAGTLPEVLDPVLARVDAATRLTWALGVAEPSLSAWAGARGAEAAVELGMALADLLARCAAAPNGGAVLLARAGSLSVSELQRASAGDLTKLRGLAIGLGDDSSRARAFVDAVVDASADEDLLGMSTAAALVASASPSVARFAERLAPRLVRWLVSERAPAAEVATWLAITPVRQALERLPPVTLFSARGVREWDAECLPRLSHACAEQVRSKDHGALGWIANLLERPLASARSWSLEQALDDLDTILSTPPDREGWLILAARVLRAARRTDCRSGYRVVERVFPVLYPKITKNELGSAARAMLSSRSDDWDVAKDWRHWLVDQWLDMKWPPASFLRCLGDDEALFRRIAHRARWKWRGQDFLRSLPEALTQDRELAARWRRPVERMLHDEDIEVDYE